MSVLEHIHLHDHGSIVLLEGKTPFAVEWLESNLDPDGLEWAGKKVVERRYVMPILEAFFEALEDGER